MHLCNIGHFFYKNVIKIKLINHVEKIIISNCNKNVMLLLFRQLWAEKAGFVLANDLDDFNDNYRLRIILADKVGSSHDVRANLPNKTDITSKIIYYFLYNVIL